MTNAEIAAEAVRIQEKSAQLIAVIDAARHTSVGRLMCEEIERLRGLLDEHGISWEPEIPQPAQFGPPTLLEHITLQAVKRMFVQNNGYADELFAVKDYKIGRTLRIRLPVDYAVERNIIT